MSNIVSQFVDQVDDTKINITANGLNKPLSDAINDGDIGAGASFKLEIVGHSFSLLEPVYHDGTDWVIAQASQANTLPLYVVTKIDGDVVTFTKFGKVEITGHGLLVGEYYFASQAVAGAITSAEPTSGYSCPVLYVEDANNVHILVHRPSLIGTGPGDDSEVGSVVAFATDIDPAGFILCDGSAVSRIEYAELFAVIGTRHGSGDGSTTFNLPDMRGKFIRGWDNGAGNDPNSGSRTAPVTGAATADNVGSTQGDATAVNSLSMSTDGGHNHESFSSSAGKRLALYSSSRATANPNTLASNVVTGTSGSPGVAALTTSNGSHSHPLSGDPETRPLNVYMAYYIRYSPKPILVPEIETPAGGGGGSFVWEASGNVAPLAGQQEGVEYLGFDSVSGAELYATIRVPDSYSAGDQILLKGAAFFSAAGSGNVLFKTQTKLIKPGSTAFGSLGTAHESVNAEITLTAANQIEETGDCQLTSANGLINSLNVEAGDLLSIRLFRDSANETASAAGDANFIKYSATVDFSGA
jgi:microcystin-dependent protein